MAAGPTVPTRPRLNEPALRAESSQEGRSPDFTDLQPNRISGAPVRHTVHPRTATPGQCEFDGTLGSDPGCELSGPRPGRDELETGGQKDRVTEPERREHEQDDRDEDRTLLA